MLRWSWRSYPDELLVELVAPDGRVDVLWNHQDLDADELFINEMRPNLAGAPIAGTWTLSVLDDDWLHEGAIESWGLSLR